MAALVVAISRRMAAVDDDSVHGRRTVVPTQADAPASTGAGGCPPIPPVPGAPATGAPAVPDTPPVAVPGSIGAPSGFPITRSRLEQAPGRADSRRVAAKAAREGTSIRGSPP